MTEVVPPGSVPRPVEAISLPAEDARGGVVELERLRAALTEIAAMGLGRFGWRPSDVAREALALAQDGPAAEED